jgi:hypothetical protein
VVKKVFSIQYSVVRIILVLFSTFFFLLFTSNTFAQNPNQETQFATSYDITYDVREDGITEVTQDVTLKNLTDRFYPVNFSLLISSTKILDVQASDTSGLMETTVTPQGSKSKIEVKFNNHIVGLDKEYKWRLKYKSSDFAERQGKIWQITIPKINSTQASDDYKITLIVPVSFGDPTTISPKPVSNSEIGGRLNYNFVKDQLLASGIFANFGSGQHLNFLVRYDLKNDSLFPQTRKISLPPNTEFQEVVISSLNPKPDQVVKDLEGNLVGFYKVDRRKTLVVTATGEAKLRSKSLINKENISPDLSKKLLSPQKYWEVNNPLLEGKLLEIFNNSRAETNQAKALLINQYVSSTLIYDTERAKEKEFTRLGALTSLNNNNKALDAEFSDLFIALARTAGIPSRMLVGFAYTGNNSLRPQSFSGSLHTWPEYYDSTSGWNMIDPEWQQTTGGVDYFHSIDLNHLVFAIWGLSSNEPPVPDQAIVHFSETDFNPYSDVQADLNVSREVYAGFPNGFKVRFQNFGNAVSNPSSYTLTASKLAIDGPSSGTIPQIPPYGFYEISYRLRAGSLFESYNDSVKLNFNNKTLAKDVEVKAFLNHQYLIYVVGLIVGVMFILYLLVFGMHFTRVRKHHKK